MKHKERRQYEMLLRIRDFGHAYGDAFARSPAAREAFAAVGTAANDLAAADLLKLSARVEGRADRKAAARKALITRLVRVCQLARVLRAREHALPAFTMPRSSTDQGWVTLARQFVRFAAAFEPEFSRHGVDLAGVERAIAAFETTTRDRAMKQADHTEARTRIHDLIASALLDARRLDLIVDHVLAGDSATRAVWKQVRHVERSRMTRRGVSEPKAAESIAAEATTQEPVPANVVPIREAA